MKILHINKFLYRRGGAESYMLDVGLLQQLAGHTVEYFGMQHPENPGYRYEKHFPKEIELDPPPPTVTGKAMAIGRMIHSPSAARGLAKVLDHFRPDVAHLHNVYHQLSPSILRPLSERGITTVMTLHDYKLACPTYGLLANGEVCEDCLDGKFIRHTIKRKCNGGSAVASAILGVESTIHRQLGSWGRVDRFICPSQFLADKMTAAGVFPDRMRLINHFVDTAGITPATEIGSGVVCAGRLAAEKAVDVLIDAIGMIDDVHLTVVGDGPERSKLEAQAERVAPGRVTFSGRLEKDEVIDLMQEAVVVAVPSRGHENQPMAVLESFTCGTPVVATTLGGFPELVQPGIDGELVPPNDAEALADALRPFLADPEGARAKGLIGRERLVDDFSVARHLERLRRVYEEVMAEQRAGRIGPP